MPDKLDIVFVHPVADGGAAQPVTVQYLEAKTSFQYHSSAAVPVHLNARSAYTVMVAGVGLGRVMLTASGLWHVECAEPVRPAEYLAPERMLRVPSVSRKAAAEKLVNTVARQLPDLAGSAGLV